MESLFSLPLPFQRRLTKMYTDTKSSYDFVKEPVQAAEDPELLQLHRKLRIQKDRLVSWGLEWSDPSQSPDIDESINKAGLSELVGSVMSTIKEILAEAEPLWQSSKRSSDESRPIQEKNVDRKQSLITWDKSRFQDLVRDLTMSIDTLYDLSRTRQSARKTQSMKQSDSSSSLAKVHAVEERLFESNRIQTPKQINPATLVWPRDMKGILSGMLQPAKSHRQIVFMRRPTSVPDPRKQHGQQLPLLPVLLEHAPYDPIYSITGIAPSLSRFEKLFAALSQSYISTGKTISGLLNLIGYFEEADNSRFCLLYALPSHFGPVDIESPRMPSITFLSDMLFNPFEPTLEIKYRLAHNIATAVFDLHSKGIVHGNISPSNVVFIEHQSRARSRTAGDSGHINMRQSFLSSYDLFSDNATDSTENTSTSLYKHPLDPRNTRYTHLTSDSKSLDLYSLAMLLLEIGLWTSLSDIFPTMTTIPENPTAIFKQLATRCGSLYMKAVQACWRAPEDELSQRARADVMHQKTFWKVSKALQTCCALDDAEEETQEAEDSSTPQRTSRSSTPLRRGLRESKSQAFATPTPPIRPAWGEKSHSFTKPSPVPTFPEVINWAEKPTASVKITGTYFVHYFSRLLAYTL
jgi:serine/threonine protein kinase